MVSSGYELWPVDTQISKMIRPRMEKLHSDRPRTGRSPCFLVLPGSESSFTEITEYIYFSLI